MGWVFYKQLFLLCQTCTLTKTQPRWYWIWISPFKFFTDMTSWLEINLIHFNDLLFRHWCFPQDDLITSWELSLDHNCNLFVRLFKIPTLQNNSGGWEIVVGCIWGPWEVRNAAAKSHMKAFLIWVSCPSVSSNIIPSTHYPTTQLHLFLVQYV